MIIHDVVNSDFFFVDGGDFSITFLAENNDQEFEVVVSGQVRLVHSHQKDGLVMIPATQKVLCDGLEVQLSHKEKSLIQSEVNSVFKHDYQEYFNEQAENYASDLAEGI